MRLLSLSIILIITSSFVLKANDTLQRPLIHSINWKLFAINSVTSATALTLREWRKVPTETSMKSRQNHFIIPNWDVHKKAVNEQWDLYSDIGAYGSFALPAGLFVKNWLDHSRRGGAYTVRYIETSWMTISSVMLLKYSVYRPRPFTYGLQDKDGFKKRDSASFVSGHTAITASNCLFFYLNVKDQIDKPWIRNTLLGVSLGGPAFVGYARMEAGQHFITDVLAGYLVGLSSAYLIHALHNRRDIHLFTSPNGIGFNLNL